MYAALVATASLVWKIMQDRARVIVRAQAITETEGEEILIVDVVNKRRRPLNLKNIGVALSDGSKYYFDGTSHDLPATLPGEDSYTTHLKIIGEIKKSREVSEMNDKNKRISVKCLVIEDATGKLYKGRIPKYVKKRISM